MKKENKQKVLTLVLAVLLIIAIAYIGAIKYQQAKEQQQLAIFQEGLQYGYEQAIRQLIEQVSTCQEVPVFIGNQTISVIAVECLGQESD